MHCVRVLPNIQPAIYGTHTMRSDLRRYGTLTSTATMAQSETASPAPRATVFTDQPCARRLPYLACKLTKTIRPFNHVFWPCRGVHSSFLRLAPTGQLYPGNPRRVQVQARTWLCHMCADVESWFDSVGLLPAPVLVSMNLCSNMRDYFCADFWNNPQKGRQLYTPACLRATHRCACLCVVYACPPTYGLQFTAFIGPAATCAGSTLRLYRLQQPRREQLDNQARHRSATYAQALAPCRHTHRDDSNL